MDKTKQPKEKIKRFYEIELEKIISATQTLCTTRVTAGGITATIALGILGAAFKSEIPGGQAASFFATAALSFCFILLDVKIKSAIAQHYLRASELIYQLSIDDENALSSIFVFSEKGRNYILEQLNEPNAIRRKNLKFFGLKFPSLIGFWLPLAGIIIEVIIGILFMTPLQKGLF